MKQFLKKIKRKHIIIGAITAVAVGIILFYGISFASLLSQVKGYKQNISAFAECAMADDTKGISLAADGAVKNIKALDRNVNMGAWNIFRIISSVREDLKNARVLIGELDDFTNDVIADAAILLTDHPIKKEISRIKLTGVDSETGSFINAYNDFLNDHYDTVAHLMQTVDSLPEFNIGKIEDKISGFRYPAKLAFLSLPEVKNLSSTVIKPVAEKCSSDPLVIKEGPLLESCDETFMKNLLSWCNMADGLSEEIISALDGLDKAVNIENSYNNGKDTESGLEKYITKIQMFIPSFRDSVPDIRDVYHMLIKPALETAAVNPPALLKQGDAFDVAIINSYIDLAEELRPSSDRAADKLHNVANTLTVMNKNIDKAAISLEKFGILYDRGEGYLPLIRAVLKNDNEKHVYMIAAQNSTEIRASGGFPGSMAFLNIDKGMLTLSDFMRVWDIIARETPEETAPTDIENKIFINGLKNPRDADFCPHFPRVAEIWASAFKALNGYPVEGVISLTPAVVGKMTALAGKITLSDGTVVTSENATKFIEHDIYFKFFGNDTSDLTEKELHELNLKSDKYLAEVAGAIMKGIFENISIDGLIKVIDILESCMEDRTFMMWMDDKEEQKLVAEKGMDGSIYSKPEDPKIGVYYSCKTSSKLGWFLDLDIKVGKARIKDDNTRSYKVTVKIKNTIDKKSLKASTFVIGKKGGSMQSLLHLVAPAGGKISKVKASSKKAAFKRSEYLGLKLAYLPKYYMLAPGESLKITFNVTTAEGVTKMPEIIQTPTLKEYWK